ncbi:MAG TPA: HAMP domain-containing sensor histidine kinase [Nitrospirota bacterium]
MKLNVSQKIVFSEVVVAALMLATLVPYILVSMEFTPLQLFHYVTVTLFILAPLGLGSLFYFTDKWECRSIEMLSFYLERRLSPPADLMAAARLRTLNLPFLHSASVLVRYEIICILDCLYMATIGHLPLRETLRLGLYACIGVVVFPIFSFFLTERFLYPVRQILAEKTRAANIDESQMIKINTRTRLVSILLTAVIAPLLALGALVYRWVGTELSSSLGDPVLVRSMMGQLSSLIFIVTAAALILAAGIGILLATSISNPLGHMVDVIRQLERGNLMARTNLISNDELGVVSQSLDTMAIQIEISRSELEDLNRNLEFRVAEKTDNLTRAYERLQLSNQNLAVANRELEEANRKLKEVDQLKSDFVSVVSHELRTPITSIKAFAELIMMKPQMPAEKRGKLLSIINNETTRLTRLINDFLDLTRIEAGKLSWHIDRLSLDDIVQRSVACIQSLADNKSLNITTRIDGPLPPLYGDRDRLIQVLTNILSNSIKFTPQGGRINIALRREETPKPQIVVDVSDTGVGIRESDLKLIFEKFRRSGDALTNTTEGTGLGLAITRQIVEYHGGEIWAASRPGEGSMFTFTLPLNKQWNIEDEQAALTDL